MAETGALDSMCDPNTERGKQSTKIVDAFARVALKTLRYIRRVAKLIRND